MHWIYVVALILYIRVGMCEVLPQLPGCSYVVIFFHYGFKILLIFLIGRIVLMISYGPGDLSFSYATWMFLPSYDVILSYFT